MLQNYPAPVELDMEMAVVYKTKTKMYWVWRGMLLRCSSMHPTHFSKYRARGITVCDRWMVFENFLADMGKRPKGMSIDRINNDIGYGPENCRWATCKTQSRNRRSLRPVTFNGKTQLLTDWAEELGMNISTLSLRLNKWSVEKSLTKRVQ